jgi:hypothetical protein
MGPKVIGTVLVELEQFGLAARKGSVVAMHCQEIRFDDRAAGEKGEMLLKSRGCASFELAIRWQRKTTRRIDERTDSAGISDENHSNKKSTTLLCIICERESLRRVRVNQIIQHRNTNSCRTVSELVEFLVQFFPHESACNYPHEGAFEGALHMDSESTGNEVTRLQS